MKNEIKKTPSNLSALNIWLHVVKNSKPQRKSLIFLFFFLNTHMQSVWPNHKIFQRHDSEQCLVMFYRQNFSRLYTLRIFFKVFGPGTNLSPQTSRVQLWQICDLPSFAFPYIQCSSHRRFTLRARNKIFFFPPLSLSLVMSQLG